MTILKIDSSITGDNSVSRQLTQAVAGQLLKAGFPLTVYNRTAERAKPLEQQGAKIASSPREGAKDADVILAMVADDNVSRAVWLGEDGALLGAKAVSNK